MPQTTYMPLYAASYPILAKVQKPGGVTVLSAVTAGDVPNKPTYSAGTIQMASFEAEPQSAEPTTVQSEDVHEEATQEDEPVEEEDEADAEVEDEPEDKPPTHHRGRQHSPRRRR